MSGASPRDRENVSGEVYQFIKFGEDELSGLLLSKCQFVQCEFQGTSVDVLFEHCRFEGCRFFETGFEGSYFLNCNFEGENFLNAVLDDSSFTDCNLNDAQFVSCSLFGVAIVRSDTERLKVLDCDAHFFIVEDVVLDGAALDDSDFSFADLSRSYGLTAAQLEPADGNALTRLPDGVERPEHWLPDDNEASADAEGIVPKQVPAPLRVIWRNSKLVPDPRGGATDQFRNPSVMALFRGLESDLAELASRPQTDHPIFSRVRLLNQCFVHGITGVNPAEVGYHLEVLKAQLRTARDELGETSLSRLDGAIAGISLFVAQFEEWRSVALNADVADSTSKQVQNVAAALESIADSMRTSRDLFDKRVGDALRLQAGDLRDGEANAKIHTGAVNSAGNLASALSGRLWRLIQSGTKTTADETLKFAIKQFLQANQHHLMALVAWAPRTFAWLKAVWSTFFG